MLQPARIGFSTTNALFSRIIRRLTESKVSHAFLVYWDADFERDMVMEAMGRGFRIVPFDKFQLHNRVVEVFTPRHSIERGLRRAVDWLGTDYDARGLLGMALVVLARWFTLRRRRNPFGSSRALFCSEAVARACAWSDYPGFELDPEATTPQDLFDFFAAENGPAPAAAAGAA